jgi:O-antigen/teichoic acid export membrane protein
MSSSNTKRPALAANSLFSVGAWLFPILLGFIATPTLVRNLGSEQYGLFAVVLGFVSYSFSFGIGKVAGKFLPEYQALGEERKSVEFVSATFIVTLAIGALGAMTLILTAPIIVRDVMLIDAEHQQAVTYCLYIAAVVGLSSMLSQVFQYVLQGLHRFDNYVALMNLYALLLGTGNIALAFTGFGIVALLLWNLTVSATTAILFYIRAKHLFKPLTLVTAVPRETFKAVGRYAGNIILFQVFANALYIFERTWVMRKFGPEELTFYFVPMNLAIYMHGFVASIVQATFPVVNEMLSDRERVAALYRRANKIVLAIVVYTVTTFVTCGALFLRLWVSEELSIGSETLLVLHGLTFSIIAIGILALQTAEAFRFPVLNVVMTGSWMLLGIPMMIFFADIWGAEGVAIARFAAALVVSIPVIMFSEHRFLGGIQWRFWGAVGVRIGIAIAVTVLVQEVALSFLGRSYVSLFVAGIFGGLTYLGSLLVAGFVTEDDKELLRWAFLRRSEPVAGTSE